MAKSQSISPFGSEPSKALSPQIFDFGERALARCRAMSDMAFALLERMELLEARIRKSRGFTGAYVGDT